MGLKLSRGLKKSPLLLLYNNFRVFVLNVSLIIKEIIKYKFIRAIINSFIGRKI